MFLVERKDYIAEPKENGYRSLHLIVSTPIFLENNKRMMEVEVQMRTLSMDTWASLEHKFRYKKESNPYIDVIAEELRACADACATIDARMQHVHDLRNM